MSKNIEINFQGQNSESKIKSPIKIQIPKKWKKYNKIQSLEVWIPSKRKNNFDRGVENLKMK